MARRESGKDWLALWQDAVAEDGDMPIKKVDGIAKEVRALRKTASLV